MIKRSLTSLLAASLMVVLVAMPASASHKSDPPADPNASVASVASSSKQFDILVDLVVEAGLAGALSATGNDDALGAITVFAPTDRAFRKLVFELELAGGASWWEAKSAAFSASEAEIADAIIDATGGVEGLLDEVLLYHVSNALGAVPFDVAKTLPAKTPLPMLLDGSQIFVSGVKDKYVKLNDTNDVLNLGGKDSRRVWVIRRLADIPAGDDVIHGINRVLLP